MNYSQAFPTGTSFSLEVDNNRQATNSIFSSLTPALGTYYRFTIQQQLLAGFGTGPNLRYLRIAKNNKKISDIAFKMQVIATITQIANIYWDLVSAYQAEKVTEQSFAFAQQSLESAKKQLQLEAIPGMDVMRAEAEVSRRDQDLTVAKTTLQLQESLIKNALTKKSGRPDAGVDAGGSHRPSGFHSVGSRTPDAGVDRAGAGRPSGAGRIDLRSQQSRHHPQGRRQCLAADSYPGRFLWRNRTGG